MRVRARLAVLAAAALLGAVAGGAGAVAPAADAAVAGHCKRGYVSASLSWGHKCLKAGQFCTAGNREYARYGFTCPSSGRLRKR
ncbi:MAG TPA: hypothetical protein VM204_03175 [Gaiellaceae bacterium]|nr:hypothetical protein [Gaiellaceae bacterium]